MRSVVGMCSGSVCTDVYVFFKQKAEYEMRISDWSSDVCSSDLRVGSGVAVFERHHRFLAEQRVDDRGVARLLDRLLQRQVVGAALLVVQHRVAVEEGAAAAVLADQAQLAALVEQGGVGQVLGEAPVELGRASGREGVGQSV